MNVKFDHADEDLWVFAYGSLMWRPDFPFLERVPTRLMGAHRALCVYSHVHRGTPERPGLVLGLDRGGTCRGIAYRVAAKERRAVLAYLRAREQRNMVYRECMRPVILLEHSDAAPSTSALNSAPANLGRRVQALCYVVDRSHPQYAGRLDLTAQLHYVRQGHGQSGPNRDYVLATVQELEALGCRDRDLHLLAQRLHGIHESHIAPPALKPSV
ncbi:MAG TPA: gamma-glutamylcyclotransferase [Xanthobacteraceae bacterium]|jgi:cation transport protein ChaC|nr:gamma-glutamylcyclotransferase [Xanthobacteraceae bacterium]